MAMSSRELSTGGSAALDGFIAVGVAMPVLMLTGWRAKLAGYALALVMSLIGLTAVPAVRYVFSLLERNNLGSD